MKNLRLWRFDNLVREALALNQRMQQVDKITMTREKYGSKGTCAETEDAALHDQDI